MATKGIVKELGKAQNKSLRIVAGAFKATPIRNLETETWVPPLDLYFNKRLADFERRIKQRCLQNGQGGKKAPEEIIKEAYNKLFRRFNANRRRRGNQRAYGPQKTTPEDTVANIVAD